jgi:hypothetical protein
MGLLSQPPQCHISIPASESGLLKVTMDDIRAVPLSLEQSQALLSPTLGLSSSSCVDFASAAILLTYFSPP